MSGVCFCVVAFLLVVVVVVVVPSDWESQCGPSGPPLHGTLRTAGHGSHQFMDGSKGHRSGVGVCSFRGCIERASGAKKRRATMTRTRHQSDNMRAVAAYGRTQTEDCGGRLQACSGCSSASLRTRVSGQEVCRGSQMRLFFFRGRAERGMSKLCRRSECRCRFRLADGMEQVGRWPLADGRCRLQHWLRQ